MILKSPLNYTGSKKKLLDRILPIFPKDMNNFVDLFAGGLNVGINVTANTIYVNDRITYIMQLYEFFRSTDIEDLLQEIHAIIKEYRLNQNSSEGYYKLRSDFNTTKKPLNYSLIEWSKKYNVIYMDREYTNCNYQLKNRKAKTVEVVITNY